MAIDKRNQMNIKCTPKKHNVWRTPSGEVTCDCEYMEACKRIIKKLKTI